MLAIVAPARMRSAQSVSQLVKMFEVDVCVSARDRITGLSHTPVAQWTGFILADAGDIHGAIGMPPVIQVWIEASSGRRTGWCELP